LPDYEVPVDIQDKKARSGQNDERRRLLCRRKWLKGVKKTRAEIAELQAEDIRKAKGKGRKGHNPAVIRALRRRTAFRFHCLAWRL
jgi:hypothetical protein